MNPDGHVQTLVAEQQGNKNALRSGVFSVNALAPRVRELEVSIAERTIEEVQAEVRDREIAALIAVGEAMDDDLAARGLVNRSGEPRRMIELRLRLNKHLMRMVEAPAPPEREREQSVAELPTGTAPDEPAPGSLVKAIMEFHGLSSEEKLTPEYFDPEQFLIAVVVTDDPATGQNDLLRARRLLTKRRNAQSPYCTCIATLRARDVIQFHEWVAEIQGAGVEPSAVDRHLAARVRALARGDVDAAGGYQVARLSMAALEAVIAARAERRRNPIVLKADEKRFWDMLVSRSPRTSAKRRLDAFEALDEIGILARCDCERPKKKELVEVQADAFAAACIRMVAENHYRAAIVVAEYPETYLAVREAVDAALLAGQEEAATGSSAD